MTASVCVVLIAYRVTFPRNPTASRICLFSRMKTSTCSWNNVRNKIKDHDFSLPLSSFTMAVKVFNAAREARGSAYDDRSLSPAINRVSISGSRLESESIRTSSLPDADSPSLLASG